MTTKDTHNHKKTSLTQRVLKTTSVGLVAAGLLTAGTVTSAPDSYAENRTSQIEQEIADNQDELATSFATAMQSNNNYSRSVLYAQNKERAYSHAKVKLEKSKKDLKKAQKNAKSVSSENYKKSSSNDKHDPLSLGVEGEQLSGEAVTKNVQDRSTELLNTAKQSKNAAETAESNAKKARDAAKNAKKIAEKAEKKAQESSRTQQAAVTNAQNKQDKLVQELATINDTSVDQEAKRVAKLEQKRQEKQLQEVESQSAEEPAEIPTQAESGDVPVNLEDPTKIQDDQLSDSGGESSATADPTESTQAVQPEESKTSKTDETKATESQDTATAPAQQGTQTGTEETAPTPDQNPAENTQTSEPEQTTQNSQVPSQSQSDAVNPTPQAPATQTETPNPVVPQPDNPKTQTPSGGNGYASTVIDFMQARVGGPYVWGGTGPVGYDCSGLTQAAFASAGINIPRVAHAQFTAAPTKLPLSEMQPGDLLVWGSPSNFSHVAVYIGDGKVVHAFNPTDGITITPISWMSGMGLYPQVARY